MSGILLLILAAGWLYYLYHQPRVDVTGKDVEYVVTAIDLFDEFEKNDAEATAKYADKILIVSGTVKEFIGSGEHLTIKLDTGNDNGDINADLNKMNKEENIVIGNKILLKGRCTGFLSDVYLADCIIENKINNHEKDIMLFMLLPLNHVLLFMFKE